MSAEEEVPPLAPLIDDPDELEAMMPDDDGEPVEPRSVKPRGLLPEEFWSSRPEFLHIRNAAHAEGSSGEVALYVVLSRLSAMISHHVKANTGMKGRASLNLNVALVGPSGAGKSTGKKAGGKLLTIPGPDLREFRDDLPIGTGEGIAETFMGEVVQNTGDSHTKGPLKGEPVTITVRQQVRHNAFFYADEGEALTKVGGRNGSTIGETIRRAAMGETLGQTNAEAARNRHVPEGMYCMGLVVGFQPESALPLLAEAPLGTPQRFLWSPVIDPSIPQRFADKPKHPGILGIKHQPQMKAYSEPFDVKFPVEVSEELWRVNNERARGEVEVGLMDGHEQAIRIKVAALLALLHGRTKVELDDWALSLVIWRASSSLRDSLLEQAHRRAQEERERSLSDHVEKHRRATSAQDDDRTTAKRVARWLARRVGNGPATVGALRKAMPSRDRNSIGKGLDYAAAEGWISVDGDRVSAGESSPS